MNDSTTSHVTCNFCGKRQGQVAKIVAGAGVYTRRQAEAVLAEIADDTAGLLAEAARMPADGWHRRLARRDPNGDMAGTPYDARRRTPPP